MTKNKLNSIFEKIKGAIFLLFKKALFTSIRDLRFTMRMYVDLIVNNNLNSLKRFKIYVPKKAILSAFDDIQKEYMEITQTSNSKAKISRKDRYNRYVREYQILVACGTILSVNPENRDVIEFLERSRIKGDNLLKKIQSEIKAIQSKIDEIKSLEEQESTKKEDKKISIEDYSTIFAVLNKNGYKASWDMSVIDFIKTMDAYKHEAEENKRQMEKIKSKK